MNEDRDALLVRDVIAQVGGEIVGRVRLQKVFYLLDQIGLKSGFEYDYHHYGPFSKVLSDAVEVAKIEGLITEARKHRQSDGVPFSVFSSSGQPSSQISPPIIGALKAMKQRSATVLELAATIHWLAHEEKVKDLPSELRRRKGVKTEAGRMEQALALLKEIGIGIADPGCGATLLRAN